MKKILEETYEKMCDDYMGWCVECEDFTTSMVELDAEDYPCDVCGNNMVWGAEQALLMGYFEIEG